MKLLSTLILVVYAVPAFSQCDSISLPESINICKNSTVTLPATLFGGNPVLNIHWSPSTGLSDTTILNPVLTSGSTSGWYYVTVSSLSATNLIVNGDFSAGNTGFTSGYSYVPPSPSALWPAGVYVVDTDPAKDHPLAPSFGDHTTGKGNMMAMNGASTPIDVWCETVPVTPNTDYAFSAWFSNWSGDTLTNLPLIQFQINGTLLGTGTFKFIPTQGLWTKFYSTWNSGTSTSAGICIYDMQTAAYGNDFAVDDISFRQMCTIKDSVFINISVADSSHHHYDTSVCSLSGTVTLNAPAGYSSYSWNTGATTASVTISSSGSYWLFGTGNCGTLKDTFNVYFTSPDTIKKYKDTILCASAGAITLNAPSGYHSWLWNNGASTPTISVASTGTYWVSASSNSGCSIISDTIHAVFSPLPVAFIGNDTSICTGDKIKLSTSADKTASYLWSTGSTAPSITVADAGTYNITVTNNGCSANASIRIREITKPQINLGNDTTLCTGEVLKLPVSASNASFLWSDGSKAPDFTATETGVYWSTVSNICGSVTDTISITYDFCDIWFPSAFTPNGDGRNDIIRVVGSLSAYKDFSYSIFNRWGQRVFYTENIYDGWDGIFNGSKQDLGTYFYLIYYSLNGRKSMMKGDFQLIR
jgi:gliding motility-associated-like protein